MAEVTGLAGSILGCLSMEKDPVEICHGATMLKLLSVKIEGCLLVQGYSMSNLSKRLVEKGAVGLTIQQSQSPRQRRLGSCDI